MARPARPAPNALNARTDQVDLVERIASPDNGWDFFHALRSLQADRLDLPPIGTSGVPDQDAVRFGQHVSLAFPPTSMAGLGRAVPRPRGQTPAPRVMLNHFGLLAPAGPFPAHITRFIRRRERHHADPAAARFFDLFNHRMACLFFRAWAVNNIAVAQDRAGSDTTSRFAEYVGALCGYGTPSLQRTMPDEGSAASLSGPVESAERDSVPLSLKLHYAGRLMCPTRHPEGLAAVLHAFLNVPVRIREFIPRWIAVPPENRTRFNSRTPMAALGRNTLVGSSVYEVQSTFRVIIGPVPFGLYQRLLPGRDGMTAVRDWIRNYLCHQNDVQIQVVLARSEVPRLRLGGKSSGSGSTGSGLLGRTAWLCSGPSTADRADLIIEHTH